MVRRTENQEGTQDSALADDALKNGWAQTVADMRAMAADREEQGFETLAIVSGDTSPVDPKGGETDRWGLSYLIPGDEVDQFTEVHAQGEFTDTGVYQQTQNGHVFMVEENIDYDNELIVFVAGTFMMIDATALVRTALDRGRMYSHVRTLDRTIVGQFEHDDPAAYFPEPDSYYQLTPDFG